MTKTRWARVLIVESSASEASLLVDGISRDQRLAVAGVALSASEAVSLSERLKPDVITVDLMLPDETGLDVILRILRKQYVPMIVVSAPALDGTSNLGFRALLAGAADIVPKPRDGSVGLDEFFNDLNERISLLAAAQAVPTHPAAALRGQRGKAHANGSSVDCVVVGASTGGPTALVELLNGLGSDFPAPVVIVQHIAAPFVEGLVRWLNQETPIPVELARDGERMRPGCAYIAPASADLVLRPDAKLSVRPATPGRAHIAPSADALFDSAADIYQGRCAGVLLSGMGKDGAAGLLKVRSKGGKTFAQDERSCTVFGMPEAAGLLGAVESFSDPRTIAVNLRKLFEKSERIAG
ncbi:MAG: response regulator [Candidatus Eremiobacteraeota bacterium]|nr:response regulator [Candidatus Eremiobacteraeota bacterium]